MPTYEFLCTKCGTKEDIFLTMSKRNTSHKCKVCGDELVRLIGHGDSFIFKGNGFYETDYKRKNI